MRVRLAKKTGFCFGVRRAIDMAEAALKSEHPIYSLGSIIHNREVVRLLSRKGLRVVKNLDDIKSGTVIISSHGLSPKIAAKISRKGLKFIDTTCPFVLNAQKIARSLSEEGYKIIIAGDVKHPEIRALVDFVSGKAVVVKDAAAAKRLGFASAEKIAVISQTTQSVGNFRETVNAVLAKRPKEVRIFNTICRDAEERQEAARSLAGKVDAMLVAGGRDSANTRRLFEVCRKVIKDSYLVETEKDFDRRWFSAGSVVGITSGASTPDWVVQRVVNKIIRLRNQRAKA